MSNLGGYQILTTVAKKVHGPGNLALLLIGSGIAIGTTATVTISAIRKKIKTELEQKQKAADAAIIHTVIKDGRSNEGLLFRKGDTFKVLERDGDAGLIELTGNDNNPYYASIKFLSSISDFT